MLFQGLHEDEDVIQVYAYMSLHDKVLENVIHHGLEGSRAVGESKEHNQGFKESMVGAKGCLPFIAFLYPDIV